MITDFIRWFNLTIDQINFPFYDTNLKIEKKI